MHQRGKVLKLGMDLHGVIDSHPCLVRFASIWREMGHEIHIITGEGWETARKAVDDLGVKYDRHFSIVDYHRSIGTKMELKETGWWMGRDEWDRTKGDYCRREGIDLMFDDTHRYARWMPQATTFVLVGRDFADVAPVIADIAVAEMRKHPVIDGSR